MLALLVVFSIYSPRHPSLNPLSLYKKKVVERMGKVYHPFENIWRYYGHLRANFNDIYIFLAPIVSWEKIALGKSIFGQNISRVWSRELVNFFFLIGDRTCQWYFCSFLTMHSSISILIWWYFSLFLSPFTNKIAYNYE